MTLKIIFKKYSILVFMFLAVILGTAIGANHPSELVINIFNVFSSLISNVINFCIPLLIFAFITQGITSLKKSSGKILIYTFLIAYLSMIIAAIFSYIVASSTFSHFFSSTDNFRSFNVSEQKQVSNSLMQIEIKPIIDVVSAILISFILGLGINTTNAVNLKIIVNEFYRIIEILVKKFIVKILPIYVLTNFTKLAASGGIFLIFNSFYKVLIVIISVNLIYLLSQFIITGWIVRRNPFKLLKNIIPIYFTAFATQSSAATLPEAIEIAKENEISDPIVNFVMPLCSKIHLVGGMISLTSGAVALMVAYGHPVLLNSMLPFILILGVLMTAAPGVPCGAVLAAVSLLVSFLNFDSSMIAIITALHMCQDSFGTACNVCGDLPIALIIDKLFGKQNIKNI
ncbi:MAG: dicarboxylate/amino acid:cation symporter [Oscillospiraceae bacterium]|jgi:Na+/H+-dicarboxylate symporter|nr:dicarboxylate/amino acid:cation symporter [Oscillospiraceae bacterium]